MRHLVLTLALPALAPAAAFAEPGAEGIDEVVVTAMRRPVRADSLAFSIGTVAADDVEARKLLTDAIDAVAGVALQQTTPGQGAAIVRGQRGSAVLHLVDGFRLNNAIFRSAPTQYLALIPTGSVERVEVLKGTPASLYGSDAIGGVVQVISKRPRFDADDTKLRGELRAAADTAESMLRLGATLDAGNSRLFSSFSADWLDVGNRTVGGGTTFAPTGYESRSGRALLGWHPDGATTWSIDVQHLEQPETPRIDELVAGFGQTEPSSSEFAFKPNRRSFLLARYENTAGPFDATWTVNAGWQRIDDDRVSRDYQAPTRVIEQNRSDLLGISASVGHIDASKSWVAGIEYYDDTVSSARQNQDIVSGAVTDVQARFPDDSSVRQLGAYANSTWSLNETHSISGGLRVSFVTTGIAQTPLTPAASLDNNDVSGDVGWAMNLSSEWHITANAGFGFRAPNVFDVGALGDRPGNRFNIPNTSLESEHVLQGEVGVRYDGNAGTFSAAFFVADYRDRIVSVDTGALTPGGRDITQSVNAASSDLYGFETGFSAALSERWSLSGDLAYVHGSQRIDGGDAEPADRIPPLQGSLRIEFQPGSDLRVSAWLRFADRQNRLSARDVRDPRINPAGTPGWSALGMRGTWHPGPDWELSATLENLLDTGYRLHGSGIDATGRNLVFAIRRSWR